MSLLYVVLGTIIAYQLIGLIIILIIEEVIHSDAEKFMQWWCTAIPLALCVSISAISAFVVFYIVQPVITVAKSILRRVFKRHERSGE